MYYIEVPTVNAYVLNKYECRYNQLNSVLRIYEIIILYNIISYNIILKNSKIINEEE